ncbi:MAG: hypothetical protein ACOCUH_04385, partial [Bacteriovoracia bacterium]
MTTDCQYHECKYLLNQVDHRYGEKVRICYDPSMLSLLAKLSSSESSQPLINIYVEKMYQYLIQEVLNYTWPIEQTIRPTRMIDAHPEGNYCGPILNETQKIISVSLARAGILPSQTCYNFLNLFL